MTCTVPRTASFSTKRNLFRERRMSRTISHAQIQSMDRVVDIPECAEDGDSCCLVRLVCVPEARDELSSMD